MRIESFLTIGSRVHIVSREEEDPDVGYVSRLEDLREDGLAIGVPLRRGRPLLLQEGDRVMLRIATGNGALEFESTVSGQAESSIRLYLVSYPQTWERVQLRENVRLKVTLRVECSPESEAAEDQDFYTHDISAGGLGLRSREKIAVGTKLWLYFKLKQEKAERVIKSVGEVVRFMGADGPQGDEYRIGVRFVQISPSDQDFIVGFIFQRMIRQRQIR